MLVSLGRDGAILVDGNVDMDVPRQSMRSTPLVQVMHSAGYLAADAGVTISRSACLGLALGRDAAATTGHAVCPGG